MKNLTAVDYIKNSIDQDFETQAPIIQTWLENRMEDLADEWIPIADEEQAGFQSVLELLVYPYLSCYKALIDADVPETHAGKYCQRIWKKMPTTILETTLASLV